MTLVKLALLHLGWLGTGLLVLELVAGGRRLSARRLREAYLTGMALHVAALYAWAALAPVPVAAGRGLIGAGLACGLLWLLLRRRRAGGLSAEDRPAGRAPGVGLPDLVLAAVLAPPLLLIVLSSWCVAMHHWDPLAIWATKAELLFHGEHLRSEAFVDPHRINPHHGYPIGYSLVLFEHAAAAGSPDELMMNRGQLVVVLAGLGLLGLLMAEWAGRRLAMAAVGLLLWAPAMWRPELATAASSGYADLPLGLCAALGAGLLVRGLAAADRGSLAAASACLVLAASFKPEGMVWAVMICGLGIAALALRPERRSPAPWLALLVPLAALGLIRLAQVHLPTTSDVAAPSGAEVAVLLGLLPRLAETVAEHLLANPLWGALRLFLPVALAVGLVRARRRPLALLGLAAPLYLGISIAVLGLIEVQAAAMDGYVLTMFPRLVVQLLPSALLFAVVLNSTAFARAPLPVTARPTSGSRSRPAGRSPAGR
ncbi:MAG TPA: hypothetical protein VLT32_01300 [Candidatus Sulfomarinibacteraceae bacterium]|nr:hypothetical protein [Candidatus Sulfomarinibacteraceae bacterium]